MNENVVLILGGGFGGVKTALSLARKKMKDTRIVLVSDRPHFEYHATLYRVLTGHSPFEVCIPLDEIFHGTDVEICEDTVISVNLQDKVVTGQSGADYHYDTLVYALGSEVAYYNTEGLKEYSFSINSISSVLKLKRHFHEIINQDAVKAGLAFSNIVIVGGGVTGCEVAGELSEYLHDLAVNHGIDPSLISIDLIHGGNRLVPNLPEEISHMIEDRIRSLGVNIILNHQVIKEDVDEVYLPDMKVKTKTLIWTAGVRPNHLYAETKGLQLHQSGKVLVDEYLQALGYENVFVIGDAAVAQYPGMAQTALHQANYVAELINKKLSGGQQWSYVPKKPIFSIPIGRSWAITVIGKIKLSGKFGWLCRKYMDLRFFASILPLDKAITAFQSDRVLCETCDLCSKELSL